MRLAKSLTLLGVTALATLTGSEGLPAQASKCALEGGALNFGAYNPGFVANLDVMGSLTLTCGGGNFQVQLSMSVGTGPGANYTTGRIMTGSGGSLVYNLYTDPSRSLVLGDGTNGSARLNIAGRGTVNQVLWGRIPAGQTGVLPGAYVDTLIATVSY